MSASTQSIPLFERFPRLGQRIARVPLVASPTPVVALAGFGAVSGLRHLSAKREDLTHPQCGGNKVRGLEFLLADAMDHCALTLVTAAAAGSNHILATAWHGRQLGMDTVAFVAAQPPAGYVRHNLVAGAAAGARYVRINPMTAVPLATAVYLRLRVGGSMPYIIPPGGSSPLASLGHVNAALELKQQIDAGIVSEPDLLFVGLGSLGTAAGLAVGVRLAGLRTRVAGVVTFHRWYCTARRWARLARRTAALMRLHDPSVPAMDFDASELTVVPDALGRGYAHFTEDSIQIARELKTLDELTLDGTYTAKVFAGAMAYVARRGLQSARLLMWHTTPVRPKVEIPSAEALPENLRRLAPYFRTVQPLDTN